MKVLVKSNLKLGKSESHKPGALIDLDDKVAKKLLMDGVVMEVPKAEKKSEKKAE